MLENTKPKPEKQLNQGKTVSNFKILFRLLELLMIIS